MSNFLAAQLYREEIKYELTKRWYDEKYKYYFGGCAEEFNIPNDNYWRRDFAHLDIEGNLDGYFSYKYDPAAKSLSNFGLIGFAENNTKLVFDALSHIKALFKTGEVRRVCWWAFEDNPANKLYERIIRKYNGKINGKETDCAFVEGRYWSSISYEIICDGGLYNEKIN